MLGHVTIFKWNTDDATLKQAYIKGKIEVPALQRGFLFEENKIQNSVMILLSHYCTKERVWLNPVWLWLLQVEEYVFLRRRSFTISPAHFLKFANTVREFAAVGRSLYAHRAGVLPHSAPPMCLIHL